MGIRFYVIDAVWRMGMLWVLWTLCGERWVCCAFVWALGLAWDGVSVFSYRCVCDEGLEKLCIFVAEHSHL